jgi:hypothetical protein
MSYVESCYQATTGEDSRLRRLSTFCSKLQSVGITDSTIVTCGYNIKVVSKSNI